VVGHAPLDAESEIAVLPGGVEPDRVEPGGAGVLQRDSGSVLAAAQLYRSPRLVEIEERSRPTAHSPWLAAALSANGDSALTATSYSPQRTAASTSSCMDKVSVSTPSGARMLGLQGIRRDVGVARCVQSAAPRSSSFCRRPVPQTFVCATVDTNCGVGSRLRIRSVSTMSQQMTCSGSGSQLDEAGGTEVAIEGERLADSEGAHDREACRVDKGVLPLIVLAQPRQGSLFCRLAHPGDGDSR
jgi:hypothetical protein